MTTFFSSDYHLFHDKVLLPKPRWDGRPFKSLEEMHKETIKRHNNLVKKQDTFFFLGDLTFADKEKTKLITERLNGRKIIIKGNHDRKRSNQWYLDIGFDQVSEWPLIIEDQFILSHEPLDPGFENRFKNIHGHLHHTEWKSPNYINIGVDNWNFSPVSLEQVKEYFQLN